MSDHGSAAVVHVAVTGRVTPEAVADFCAALEEALARPGGFAVLFDRRAMTAPTGDGRAALERMAVEVMPRLVGRCLGWADLYDERRAASLANAAARDGVGDEPEPVPYPSETFSDPDRAVAWVTRCTSALAPPDERS